MVKEFKLKRISYSNEEINDNIFYNIIAKTIIDNVEQEEINHENKCCSA